MKIAPSILTADFLKLEEEIKSIEQESDYLHLDVMDGHFVPNISFGSHVLSGLKRITNVPLDTHLMISNPIDYIKDFAGINSSFITIHVEANKVKETLDLIHSYGIKRGLSLKPKTSLDDIKPYLSELELVLVMSVEPGFGGQSFMVDQLDKVRELVRLRDEHHYNYVIEIDGGINFDTAKLAKEAGVDIAVAGSYVFNAKDRNEAIRGIK